MSDSKPYEEMSDEELIADLHERLGDRSWTLGQFAELERRGFDSIKGDEELRLAVTEDYETFMAKLRASFEPLAKRVAAMSGISEQIAAIGKSLAPKFKIDLPDWSPPTFVLPTTALDVGALAAPMPIHRSIEVVPVVVEVEVAVPRLRPAGW